MDNCKTEKPAKPRLDKQIKRHLIMVWATLVLSPGAVLYIFQPHFERAVVNSAMKNVRFTKFIAGMDETTSRKLEYKIISEMLTIFRNIPSAQRTEFQNAEIKRLEAKQAFLLSPIIFTGT